LRRIPDELLQGKRPDLVVRAHQEEKHLGACTSLSCAAFSRDAALEDWHFCDGLDIIAEMQGRGLGRHLLERARLEMHAVGYRHAGISTSLSNYRAFQFYSNYGYRVVDHTYGWDKDL
jgi:GNAT superfamily N-acetyltransferase